MPSHCRPYIGIDPTWHYANDYSVVVSPNAGNSPLTSSVPEPRNKQKGSAVGQGCGSMLKAFRGLSMLRNPPHALIGRFDVPPETPGVE
jgi:hypothetical protein